MKKLAVAVTLMMVGCTSVEEKREYRQAQVDMVKVQQQSKEAIALQREQAQAQMWSAAAEIVKANPDSADAFAVVMGVRVASEDDQQDAPLVTLQREENEALAVVKSVAPALVTTLGQVGIAALQADVNKTQSDNAARVAIADAATDADIMRSVTGMAQVGLNRATTQVGGDYYVAETLDQSLTVTNTVTDASTSTTTETNTSTSTETNTSTTTSDSNNTNTETSSETNTEGSYNTSDSYNNSSDNSSDTNSSGEYQSADGSYLSADDIRALLGAGLRVRVVIGGEEVEVVDCGDELGFGPEAC